MVISRIDFSSDELQEHSKKKHRIFNEYFRRYLTTRLQMPTGKFKLCVVDGFCGAGKYKCGSIGSPLIFLKALEETIREVNIKRKIENCYPVDIECTFIFNDESQIEIDRLKANIASLKEASEAENPHLHITIEYTCNLFSEQYNHIKKYIQNRKIQNVFFVLDQYGYVAVPTATIKDILFSFNSAEILLYFSVASLKTFLPKDPLKAKALIAHPELKEAIYEPKLNVINNHEWLAWIETCVYDHFEKVSPFFTPFAIERPGNTGWNYWLMHFATKSTARSVYMDVLYDNENSQIHVGRSSGLKMLSYNIDNELITNLFSGEDRIKMRSLLNTEIPSFIHDNFKDGISVRDFRNQIYNTTSAKSSDIDDVLIKNPEIQLLTSKGNERRSSSGIKEQDIIQLNPQRRLFL